MASTKMAWLPLPLLLSLLVLGLGFRRFRVYSRNLHSPRTTSATPSPLSPKEHKDPAVEVPEPRHVKSLKLEPLTLPYNSRLSL